MSATAVMSASERLDIELPPVSPQILLRIDHEFEQVAVGVAHVITRAGLATAAGAIDGTEFDLYARVLQPCLQRRRRAIPYKTEIAAGRLRRGRARREGWILPARRPVEVDHVAADVNRDRVLVLAHLKSEAAIERDHRIHVLHRHGNVIESTDAIVALCLDTGETGSTGDRD